MPEYTESALPDRPDTGLGTAPFEPAEEAHDMVQRLREGVQDEKEKVRATKSFWSELPILILIALVVAVLIKTFLVQAFHIPSGSMNNTLLEGDRIMVNKLAYTFGDIRRGDVVVFDSPFADGVSESLPRAVLRNIGEAIGISQPEHDFIKRVIALPGETVEIRGGVVLIDGQPLDEPYVHPNSQMRPFGPVTVPGDALFVMGDNRNFSQDSRFFDAIPREDIVGKAFVIVWPPGRWGGL